MSILNESNSNSGLSNIISFLAIIVPGLLAVAIFHFTGKREKDNEKEKEQRRLEEIDAFLGSIILGLRAASEFQITKLNIFLKSIEDTNSDTVDMTYVSGFNPSEIFTISRTDLFKTLVLSREGDKMIKAQLFYDFIAETLLLIDIKNEISVRIIELHNEHIDRINLLNSHIKKLMSFHDSLIPENRISHFSLPEDLFLKQLDTIIDKFNRSDKNKIEIKLQLIDPLKNFINEFNAGYDEKMKILNDIVTDINFHYTNYSINFELYKIQITDLIDSISQGINTLNSIYHSLMMNKPRN